MGLTQHCISLKAKIQNRETGRTRNFEVSRQHNRRSDYGERTRQTDLVKGCKIRTLPSVICPFLVHLTVHPPKHSSSIEENVRGLTYVRNGVFLLSLARACVKYAKSASIFEKGCWDGDGVTRGEIEPRFSADFLARSFSSFADSQSGNKSTTCCEG